MSLIFDIPSISPTTGGGGGGGITPAGTLDINANGSYNVYNYAEANVSVLPNVTGLDITPSTSAQSFVATGGIDGYSPVNVSAVNASIDPNITSANIVNGCNILGVIGSAEATTPKEVARYVVNESGVANKSAKNLTGAFNDITKVSESAFEYAFYNTAVGGDVCFLNCTEVGARAFSSAFYSTYIYNLCFPNATTITHNSFRNVAANCPNLDVVNFCNINSAPTDSFHGAFSYSTINYADFGKIGIGTPNAFRNAFLSAKINNVNFNALYSIDENAFTQAFAQSKNLTAINLSNLTTVASNAFNGGFRNSELISFDASNLAQINNSSFRNAFAGSYNFKYFNTPNNLTGSMENAFYDCFRDTNIETFNFSGNLNGVANVFVNAFYNCQSLTSINISSNSTYDLGRAPFAKICSECPNLITADFSSIRNNAGSWSYGETVFGNAFKNDVNLTTVNLFSLTTMQLGMFDNAFNGCTNLTNMDFPSFLSWSTTNYFFNNAFAFSGIKNIYFSGLAGGYMYNSNTYRPFSCMLNNVSDCIVHFPANTRTPLENHQDFLAGFGGTNTTILFDLPNVVSGFSNFYNITSSGEMGGQAIAVNASSESADAYLALNQDLATGWHSTVSEAPHYYTIYCPEGMKIVYTSFYTDYSVNNITNVPEMINVCVSNDGTNWSEVNTEFNNMYIGYVNTTFLKPGYYKYYKFFFNSYNNDPSYLTTINRITLTGSHKYS